MSRQLKFSQAINEAIDLTMAQDSSVYIMGLGVPDPRGIFGTTLGLQQKYGCDRVMDMPAAENGMTGVAIGSALVGMRPIMTHQRVDFAILALEQIVNQAAKWQYMFGGQTSVPLVVRMVVGRAWGQGPQHSQSLHAWFAHIPGLKVVMPTTAYDAKGLLIASIEDNNPVIFIEHRWLFDVVDEVPEEAYRVPLGKARIAREGSDLTIVASADMTLEALRAAECLEEVGVSTEVIDIRTLRPLDSDLILNSVCKTGRIIAADPGWTTGGFAGEILAKVSEEAFDVLRSAPRRVALPDSPAPSTPGLSKYYYRRATHLVAEAGKMLGIAEKTLNLAVDDPNTLLDVPNPSFRGPF